MSVGKMNARPDGEDLQRRIGRGIQGQSFASTAKVSLAVPVGWNCRCTGACGLEMTATTSGSYSPSGADSAVWAGCRQMGPGRGGNPNGVRARSEEHTSERQSQSNFVCRLLL